MPNQAAYADHRAHRPRDTARSINGPNDSFAAAPPGPDELDFHALDLPRGPIHGRSRSS
jgi:hypothetical protein